MKRTMIMMLAALSVLASCTKNETAPEEGGKDEKRVELTVGLLQKAETKATTSTPENEAKVNNLQVFVFRGDKLDAYGAGDAVTELTISCTAGQRQVYALVNAPDFSLLSTKTALLAKVSQLSANTLTNFEMIGKKDVTLPHSGRVSIDVDRLVSRISLKKITRKFTSAAYQKLNFTIDGIYLVNVAADVNYSLTAVPGRWYNVDRYNSEVAELTHDAPAAPLAEGKSYATVHNFYAYQNNLATKTTRLVIEATLGDAKYYYPINLPALEPNKSYEIAEVVITRPGSDDPNNPVSFEDAIFEVKVKDWTVVPVTEGTTI